MSQKTPSNTENKSVKISEQAAETSTKGIKYFSFFIQNYPKEIFIGMILTIISSFTLVFFILPDDSNKTDLKKELFKGSNTIGGGLMDEFSTLRDLSERTKRIAFLKSEIERIISKDSISEEDSITVERAIVELEYFNKNKMDYNEKD